MSAFSERREKEDAALQALGRKTVADQMHAGAIRDKVSDLNAAICAANAAGLRVEVDTMEVHPVGEEHPRVRVLAKVSRSL